MNYMHFLPIVLIGSAAMVAYKYSRAGYESAEYTVVARDGAFEVRDYPDLLLVSTSMPSASSTDPTGFRRLFRYITGANEANQKIAMTTPVFTTMEGTGTRMSFVVPKGVAENGAPGALSADVRLETLPRGRFAAYRFSGGSAQDDFAQQKESLVDWTRRQGIKPHFPFVTARYDPPFIPPLLRRNEVLVRIGEDRSLGEHGPTPDARAKLEPPGPTHER